MARGELTIEYGIKECSKCEYFLRCEECTHSETAINDLMTYIRNETAKEIFNKLIKVANNPHAKGKLSIACLIEWATEYGVEVE